MHRKVTNALQFFPKSLRMDRRALLLLSLQPLLPPTHAPLASSSIPQGEGEIKALRRPRLKIFHPPTNSCILRHYDDPLTLAPCTQCDSWNYTPQKFLTIAGTYYCLKAVGPSLPAELSISCSVLDSQWNLVSDSGKTRISTELPDGTALCLDVDDSGTIVTNPCGSFSRGETASDGDSQWFEIKRFS